MTRQRPGAPWPLAVLAAVLGLTMGVAGCSAGQGDGPGAPPPAEAPKPPRAVPLGEAALDSPKVRIQLTEVKRVGPEVLTVSFLLVNPDKTARVALRSALEQGGVDLDSMAGVTLVDEARTKQYFVMRDDQERPSCSEAVAELAPGEQRAVWARFAGPPAGISRITVQVPGVPPFRNVPITSGTSPTGPTY